MDLLEQVDGLAEAEPGYLLTIERHAVAAARYDLGTIRLVSFALYLLSTAFCVLAAFTTSLPLLIPALAMCAAVYWTRTRALQWLRKEGFRMGRPALYAIDVFTLWRAHKAKRTMLPVVWDALRETRPTVTQSDRRTVTFLIVRLLTERLLAQCIMPVLAGVKFE